MEGFSIRRRGRPRVHGLVVREREILRCSKDFATPRKQWLASERTRGCAARQAVIARWLKGIDLRTIGSGNIGATNTARALGRGWGFTVFVLDFVKGWAPAFLAPQLVAIADGDRELFKVFVGTAAVVGHCYPIFLG